MKIFTPMLADTRQLIAKIKAAAAQCKFEWLFLREMEVSDKRANVGLLMYGNCHKQRLDRFCLY